MNRADGSVRGLVSKAVRVRIVAAPSGSRGRALALQIPALRRMIRSVQPRILMSAGNQSNLPVALACVGTTTRSVAKITNPVGRPGAGGPGQWIRRQRFGLTAWLTDMTLTLSDADAAQYKAWYPKAAQRIVAVHNPYVCDEMLSAERMPRLPGQPFRIVTVGRLSAQKDQGTLLNALGLLKRRDWVLDIIGDGPDRVALEAQVAFLELRDHVVFHGFTNPLPFFQASDLFVLSSRWEGFPAVVLEALACGCAIVATDCSPGLSQLLHSSGLGPPVPVGDADALAAAIEMAINQTEDVKDMRSIAKPWSMDAAIADHIRLLKTMG
jgi:glycosyltransferase involved in cell wall biosynthesis